MTYRNIDPVLIAWADSKRMNILKEDTHPNRRICHLSSPEYETFQFVIEPEADGQFRIDAHLIESPTDERVHFTWEAPVLKAQMTLELAFASTIGWFHRSAAKLSNK